MAKPKSPKKTNGTKSTITQTSAVYDTNLTPHQHYYIENLHELVDMPDLHWSDRQILDVPDGYEVARIDVIVRLRGKRRTLQANRRPQLTPSTA